MNNVFDVQKDFIELDNRSNRAKENAEADADFTYTVTSEFMFKRHKLMLPPETLQGLRVLDVGSCLGATGAWCLSNGASHYTGLEVQPEYANLSKQLLSKYYNSDKFTIIEQSIEEFNSTEKYDIVIASGVVYGVLDVFEFCRKLTSLAKDTIVIESRHPYNGYRKLFKLLGSAERRQVGKSLSLIQTRENAAMVDAKTNGFIVCSSSTPSLQSLVTIFKGHGWAYDDSLYTQADQQIPQVYNLIYHSRFMARFNPADVTLREFYKEINNPNAEKLEWLGNSTKQ